MKLLMKILIRIIIITILIVATVYIIRWVNTYRYSAYIDSDENSVYSNPTNFSLYNTKIEGVNVETIKKDQLNGFHLVPEKITAKGVVVTFGGSDGSTNYEVAEMLAQEGYEVYSLFFFGPNDLPSELKEVPLEFFQQFLDEYKENGHTNGPITLLAASKGAELILNLATQYEEIDHIVAYAPSAYNFFSLDQKNTNESSWSLNGQGMDYLNAKDSSILSTIKMIGGFILYYPVKYEPVYTSIIEKSSDTDLEAARIKVENFEGDGIMFAGEEDMMWQSTEMADVINQANQAIEMYTFEEAGHIFSGDTYVGTPESIIASGGQKDANLQAEEQSNKLLLEKLETWHDKQ